MTTDTQTNSPAIARILNVLLLAIIVILAIAIIGCLIGTLIMLFPNGMRESLMAQLSQNGGAVPSTGYLAVGFVGGLIMAGAFLYVAIVLKAIVKTTLNGDPFVEDNISRLRKTWVVIALAEIARVIVTRFISSDMITDGVQPSGFETRLSAWFLVFVIATMAEVFRIGLELRRDQEYTI